MRWATAFVLVACGTNEPVAPGSVTVFLGADGAAFERSTALTVPNARQTVAADIDRDGRVDFITIDGASAWPFIANGDGQFVAGEPLATDDFLAGVAITDLDGDTRLDVVLGTSREVLLYRGDGRGGFVELGRYPRPSLAPAIAVADLDLDGAPDVVTLSDHSTIVTFLNDGTGHMTGPTESPTGSGPLTLATGDFNEDGRPDVATGNPELGFGAEPPQSVSVLRGTGTGATVPMFETPIDGIPRLAVADMNNDGHLDIAVAAQQIYALLGDGAGSFTVSKPSQLPVSQIALADFNADGVLDAVVTHERELRVLLAVDDSLVQVGTFEQAEQLADVDVVDINGDGVSDLLVTAGDTSF